MLCSDRICILALPSKFDFQKWDVGVMVEISVKKRMLKCYTVFINDRIQHISYIMSINRVTIQ